MGELQAISQDYKQQVKHKSRQLSFSDLIMHIIIEDTNYMEVKIDKAKGIESKANLL